MKLHLKSLQYILALCLMAYAMVSCKKLDTQPITSYSPGNFWKEPSQASAALNGAYTLLQAAVNQEFVYYGEGRADNLSLLLENNVSSINVINNRLDPSMSYADWSNFYQVIKQANLIIKNLPEMKDKNIYTSTSASTTEYKRVLGQAYGLRALCYFYMVRIWGGVPLVTEPVTNTGDINSFKTPRADSLEIYKRISTDLILARSMLPTSYTNNMQTRAMLTQGAIDALQTDYYMWRNNIDSALITSARLVNTTGGSVNANYSLAELYNANINYIADKSLIDNSPYAKIFIDGFSNESIFEVAYSNDESTTSGIYGIFGGLNLAQFGISQKLVGSFDPNDLRYVASVLSDKYVFKYFPKKNFDSATENDKDVIIYRLADIMLLRAEALNAKGQRANAFTLVNKIRERAGLPAIAATVYNAYTVAQAQDVILDERQKELCFEGKRWFDLVRTGKAIAVMSTINGLTDKENILWPISTTILRSNPLIEQNIFYK